MAPWALGYVLGEMGWLGVHAGDEQDAAYRQIAVYAEVLRKVQNYYVTEPNICDVTTGALHGLLDSLDPDSSYLTAAEYKIYKERPATDNAQAGNDGLQALRLRDDREHSARLAGRTAHLHDGDVID